MRKGEKELPRLIKQWTSSKRYKVIDLLRYFVIIIFSLIIKHFFLKIFCYKNSIYYNMGSQIFMTMIAVRAIQGSFANCNISVDLDLFNGGIIEYI
jgi:hypothetical protein